MFRRLADRRGSSDTDGPYGGRSEIRYYSHGTERKLCEDRQQFLAHWKPGTLFRNVSRRRWSPCVPHCSIRCQRRYNTSHLSRLRLLLFRAK
jgi:hypothetical protein